jgi:hypothetical protein
MTQYGTDACKKCKKITNHEWPEPQTGFNKCCECGDEHVVKSFNHLTAGWMKKAAAEKGKGKSA